MTILTPGDRVDVGVTHLVKINREEAWIKLSINAQVLDGENADEAVQRVSEFVNTKVLEVIEGTVNTVENYEQNRKADK